MKTIRPIFLVVATGAVVLFGYANVRPRSPTEKLKPVNLISFSVAWGFEYGGGEVKPCKKK